MKLNDSVTVHHAVTSWTENVNTKNFTVCVMRAGRKEENLNPFATVDWLAYQGAPPEGMTGTTKMQKWWSGTKCADVTFPMVGTQKAIRIRSISSYFGKSHRLVSVGSLWIMNLPPTLRKDGDFFQGEEAVVHSLRVGKWREQSFLFCKSNYRRRNIHGLFNVDISMLIIGMSHEALFVVFVYRLNEQS